jgi:membrane associated rhomboid family serine protease
MATTSFGRRSAVPPIAGPSVRPRAAAVALDRPSGPSAVEITFGEKNLLADVAFLTGALIVFLMLIFAVENRAAFDIGKDGNLSVRSLIAFGATSRDMVVGAGEWWRIGLAPLLHSSASHLIGNCVALLFVGIRLEPTIGRGWFALIFVVSALGGVAGSLYGNPPGVPSVGASGAITGLMGALLTVSFNPYGDAEHQRVMRKTALIFGLPALAPLAFGASGHVDYFAHAGGAIAGGALGLALAAVWSADSDRPRFGRNAAIASLVGLAISILCVGVAVSRYRTYAADAGQFMRASDMPDTFKAGAERSADLVARYPKDPRAHLMRGFYYVGAQRLTEAEEALRTAMALASGDPAGGLVRTQAQSILALVVLERGRGAEAKSLAADGCRARPQDAIRRALDKAKLCD